MRQTELCINQNRKTMGNGASLADFSPEEAARALTFHKSFCEYAPTPLAFLNNLASDLGLGSIMLKDESRRFGLNAFKVLGGSYAIGRLLAEKLNRPFEGVTRDYLASPEVRAQLGNLTFVTATDGNHGRGVAWTARQLGHNCVVFMPKGSAEIRAENIRLTGAECHITDLNYDDTVRYANAYAEKNNGQMVQDTAWEGYEDIPRWIMQGYMTLALESLGQMRSEGVDAPTHLFLQAGVGSFAGAVLGSFCAILGDKTPVTTIVEPHLADCIYTSMTAQDGAPHSVTGDMQTIMAGLACGEPSITSWETLRDYAAASISCPDYIAANGMRILASPKAGDPQIVSGESGAVTTGVLEFLMTTGEGREMAEKLRLNSQSKVLLISTEGDTSPGMYRDIVWYGKYSGTGR